MSDQSNRIWWWAASLICSCGNTFEVLVGDGERVGLELAPITTQLRIVIPPLSDIIGGGAQLQYVYFQEILFQKAHSRVGHAYGSPICSFTKDIGTKKKLSINISVHVSSVYL